MSNVCRNQDVEERLRNLEAKIAKHYAWIESLNQEIQLIREKKCFTQKEFDEQQSLIAFRKTQLDEVRRFLNYLETKAHSITMIIGHS